MIAILSPQPQKFSTFSSVVGAGSQSKSIVMILVLGIGVCALFGYFYFREWQLNREFRRLGEVKPVGSGQGAVACAAAGTRMPLIRVSKSQSRAATAERTRLNGGATTGNGKERIWSKNGLTGLGGGAASKRGLLEVQTDNGFGEVYIDGAFFGNTPAKLKLPEGGHLVEIKSPGYEDYRREIQVVEGAELKLRPNLRRDLSHARQG